MRGFQISLRNQIECQFCQTLGLVLRLRVVFVLPLSQQEEEEQEPSPKSIRRLKLDI